MGVIYSENNKNIIKFAEEIKKTIPEFDIRRENGEYKTVKEVLEEILCVSTDINEKEKENILEAFASIKALDLAIDELNYASESANETLQKFLEIHNK